MQVWAMALQLLIEGIAHRLPHPGQRLQARDWHKENQHDAVDDGLFIKELDAWQTER
jgi:hypothetical protein